MEKFQADPDEDPLAINEAPLAINEAIVGNLNDHLFCCKVCNLLRTSFSKFSVAEQEEIIKIGRPTPIMSSMASGNEEGELRPSIAESYNNYEWLTGCEQRSSFFCWACLIFSTTPSRWRTAKGMSDLRTLSTAIRRHECTKPHLEAFLKLKTFRPRGVDAKDSIEVLGISRRNIKEEVFNNRAILKKLIRLLCFLYDFELTPNSLMSSIDTLGPIDNRFYNDFINFIDTFNDTLKVANNKQFLSSSFQNNVIQSITNVLFKKIKEDLANVNFVSIIMDQVADLGETILVSSTLRYVNTKGDIREVFLKCQQIESSRMVDSLFEVIKENVTSFHFESKVVSLSCDGFVAKSKHLLILQQRKISPEIFFIHHSKHKLSAVLSQSLTTIKECKHFFETLNNLSSNFLKSEKLRSKLNLLIRRTNPKAPEFEWKPLSGCFLKELLKIRLVLVELFRSVMTYEDEWGFETVFISASYLTIITTDFTFNMLLRVLAEVFDLVDELSDLLENEIEKISVCEERIKDYINLIKQKKHYFVPLCEDLLRVLDDVVIPKQKKIKSERNAVLLSNYYFPLYNNIIMDILTQLKYRFSDMRKLKFLDLTKFDTLSRFTWKSNFDEAMPPLKHPFWNQFNVSALISELKVIFETDSKVLKKPTASKMLKHLLRLNLRSALPETMKLCELAMTFPIYTSILSTFSHLKVYIETASIGHKLSLLPILSIEKTLLNSLLEQATFYEEVIEEFKKKDVSIRLNI